jgi:hypothetical protein
MNTQYHSTIKKTPHEVVFRSDFTLQLYRKQWLSPTDRKTAKLTHEDPSLEPEDESTLSTAPITRAEEDAGTQFRLSPGPSSTLGPLGPLVLSPKRPVIDLETSTQSDVFDEFISCHGSPIQIESSPEPSTSATQSLHIEDPIITLARDNIRVARDKMVTKHNKQSNIESFEDGDIVLVKIPRIDRTATDQRKLFGRVLSKAFRPPRYKVQTQYGIIDRLFPTKELKLVPLIVSTTIEIGDNQAIIPLSKAAKLNSSGERVTGSCQCKGQCSTNRFAVLRITLSVVYTVTEKYTIVAF